MKQILITAALFCFIFTSQLFSQGVYFQLSGGYGIPSSKSYQSILTTNYDITFDSITEYNKYQLFKMKTGKGIWTTATIGFPLSEIVNLEFMLGWKQVGTSFNEFDYRHNLPYQYHVTFDESQEFKGNSYVIAPQLKFDIPVKNNNLFIRTGLMFNMTQMSKTVNIRLFNTHPDYLPTETYYIVYDFEKKLNLGITAGLGYEFLLGGNFYLVPELTFNQMKYIPLSAEITDYKYRGNDQLNDLTTLEREIEYVDEYHENENTNENKPRKELKSVHDLSNFSLKVGIKLQL